MARPKKPPLTNTEQQQLQARNHEVQEAKKLILPILDMIHFHPRPEKWLLSANPLLQTALDMLSTPEAKSQWAQDVIKRTVDVIQAELPGFSSAGRSVQARTSPPKTLKKTYKDPALSSLSPLSSQWNSTVWAFLSQLTPLVDTKTFYLSIATTPTFFFSQWLATQNFDSTARTDISTRLVRANGVSNAALVLGDPELLLGPSAVPDQSFLAAHMLSSSDLADALGLLYPMIHDKRAAPYTHKGAGFSSAAPRAFQFNKVQPRFELWSNFIDSIDTSSIKTPVHCARDLLTYNLLLNSTGSVPKHWKPLVEGVTLTDEKPFMLAALIRFDHVTTLKQFTERRAALTELLSTAGALAARPIEVLLTRFSRHESFGGPTIINALSHDLLSYFKNDPLGPTVRAQVCDARYFDAKTLKDNKEPWCLAAHLLGALIDSKATPGDPKIQAAQELFESLLAHTQSKDPAHVEQFCSEVLKLRMAPAVPWRAFIESAQLRMAIDAQDLAQAEKAPTALVDSTVPQGRKRIKTLRV